MIRQIRLGLAVIAITAAGLFTAGAAQAVPLTCAQAGAHPTDTDIIVDNHAATDGPCNITVALNAKRNISITADGPITTLGLTLQPASNANGTGLYGEYGSIYINGSDTVVVTGNIKTTPDSISGGGHIVINAGSTLKAGTITSVDGAYIDLEVQKNGGNVPFIVGTTGTNGVGTVSTSGNNLTGQNPQFNYTTMTSTVVYVVNGNSASTGGIKLTAISSLVAASGGGSRGAGIILNAQNGTLTIPPGTMNASVIGPQLGGGLITLIADTITFTGTTTLDANGTATLTFNNQVLLSAATVNYTTLTLESDGNGVPVQAGVPNPLPSAVFLNSKGQLAVTDTQILAANNTLSDLKIVVGTTNAPLSSLSLNGTGALTAHANGNIAQTVIRGYPVTIKGTNVSLTSTGATNHGVYISNEHNPAGQPGVSFTNTGTVTLNANGIARAPSSTTDGGYVYIDGDMLTFNGSTWILEANGPTTGNGDGGVVYVNGKSLTTGATFKGAKLLANAASVGQGKAQTSTTIPAISNTALFPAIGVQTIDPSPITFGNGTTLASFNASASGGKTGGDGGKIVVEAGALTVQNVLSVNASALGTTGAGGEIDLNKTNGNTATFTYNAAPVTTIKATGGTTSGIGGVIEVKTAALSDATKTLNVNTIMNVIGGTALTPAQFDGSIKLNTVTCQQWATQKGAWPLTWWDCITTGTPSNPGAPTATEQVPVNLALSVTFDKLRTLLGGKKVQIHVLARNTQYNLFYVDKSNAGFGLPAKTGSVTLNPAGGPIDVTVWQNGSIGDPNVVIAFSDAQIREVAAHEFGHAFDISHGVATDSQSVLYNNYLTRDTNTLDYADAAFTVQRLPCQATPGFPAAPIPYANVIDTVTGLPVCVNGQLNNALLPPNGWPAGTFNSQVLATLSGELWVPSPGAPKWVEPHAQLFGYSAVGNLGARPFDDHIFDNGYFPCLKAWAQKELTSATVPTTACNLSP